MRYVVREGAKRAAKTRERRPSQAAAAGRSIGEAPCSTTGGGLSLAHLTLPL